MIAAGLRREAESDGGAGCRHGNASPRTALAPGMLDVAVKVGQLPGDTLPQTVETTHELGESASGADG